MHPSSILGQASNFFRSNFNVLLGELIAFCGGHVARMSRVCRKESQTISTNPKFCGFLHATRLRHTERLFRPSRCRYGSPMDPSARPHGPPADAWFRHHDDWFEDAWATAEERAVRRRDRHRALDRQYQRPRLDPARRTSRRGHGRRDLHPVRRPRRRDRHRGLSGRAAPAERRAVRDAAGLRAASVAEASTGAVLAASAPSAGSGNC